MFLLFCRFSYYSCIHSTTLFRVKCIKHCVVIKRRNAPTSFHWIVGAMALTLQIRMKDIIGLHNKCTVSLGILIEYEKNDWLGDFYKSNIIHRPYDKCLKLCLSLTYLWIEINLVLLWEEKVLPKQWCITSFFRACG